MWSWLNRLWSSCYCQHHRWYTLIMALRRTGFFFSITAECHRLWITCSNSYCHLNWLICISIWHILDRRVQRSLSANRNRITEETIAKQLQPLIDLQKEMNDGMRSLNLKISNLALQESENSNSFNIGSHWLILVVVLTFQVFLQWLFKWLFYFKLGYTVQSSFFFLLFPYRYNGFILFLFMF